MGTKKRVEELEEEMATLWYRTLTLSEKLEKLEGWMSRLETRRKQDTCSHPLKDREWESKGDMDNLVADVGEYTVTCSRCGKPLEYWRSRKQFLEAKADWHREVARKLDEERGIFCDPE